MKKIKVKGIAPYPGLRDLLLDLAKEDSRIEMDVEIADLEEALPIVRQAEKQHYDVIVSRGGTASFIRQQVSIPVVDIPVSGYDILRVLTLIKDSNSKPAIIGFPGICQGAETVSSLLGLEFPIYPVQHESEVRNALRQATERGAQIVLGDVVTVRTAQEMGYHGILITSGQESVQETLAEVSYVYDIYAKGQEKSRFFEELLENDQAGAIAVGTDGSIHYANRMARQWVGDGETLPATLYALLPIKHQEAKTVLREHVAVGSRFYDISISARTNNSRNKETSGFFLYLQECRTAPPMQFRRIQSPSTLSTFAQVIGSSPEMGKTLKRAKTYAQTNKRIWLTGETGSGRLHFAQSIHTASPQSRYRFYSLPCPSAEDAVWETELFGTTDSPGLLQSAPGGTLYLEDVDRLPPAVQERLATGLQKGSQLRLIVSSAGSPGTLAKRSDFSQPLLHLLAECQLRLPPLRERLEDIGEMSRVLIAHHNSAYGKHIVGIREEVMERLMEYEWPGNVKEWQSLTEEMLILTQGHYVGLPEWEAAWERYSTRSSVETGSLAQTGIDLQGTWDQIEKQIILHVLKEEGMNQSRAAKRLGINRTTLWRKLGDVLHI